MSNVLDRAVEKIKFHIPKQVLERAFFIDANRRGFDTYGQYKIPVEESIKNEVLRKLVMKDLSEGQGQEVMIPLEKCVSTPSRRNEYVIRVPKELTHGRSLVELKRIVMPYSSSVYGSNNNMCAGSAMDQALNQAMSEVLGKPSDDTTYMEIINENVIYMKFFDRGFYYATIIGRVAYSDTFHELKPPYYQDFYKLCLYAAQGYIYNVCAFEDGLGELYGGQETRMQRLIDKWEDSMASYHDFLESQFRRQLVLNDVSQMRFQRMLKFGKGM